MRSTRADRLPRVAALAAVVAVAVAMTAPAPARAAAAVPAPLLAGAWSAAERVALAAALGRLPAAVRARLPARVARDARAGDADGWPDDAALVDGAGVHLGATAGAAPADVARRVVVALLLGFDRAIGWSDEPGWRRLNRWSSPLLGAPRAGNEAPLGFADARGRRSPRWDLATFLAAMWLDPDDGAGGVSCRLLGQAEFLRAHVAALTGAPVAAPTCAAFERWAELERLADVEVVLAAPSTAMVGSLFGHLFLRLVYRDDDGATPPHLSRTVAFLADNDVPFEADRGYAWKGITGAYTASLHERAFLDSFREYVVTEGRDLRRWRLALTASERAALMARLWSVGGAGRYAYYFFRQNCATLMMDVVEDALPSLRAVGHDALVASPPASALEAWARARGVDGAPVLAFVPEPVLSFDHEARLTSRLRAALEPRIIAASPEAADPLARAFVEARAPVPASRVAAYDRLGALLADERAGGSRDVYDWLRASATIESHLSVLANLQAEARADVERRARARRARDELAGALQAEAASSRDEGLVAAVERVGDGDRERRVEGYRALRALATAAEPGRANRLRLLALLESEVRYDVERLKREPALRDALLFPDPEVTISEQAYVRGREELVRVPVATTIAPPLRALQRARERVFAARDVAAAAPAPELPVAETRVEYEASLPRSGIDQTSVSVGGLAGAGGTPAPAVGLGGALYDERLGDHRRFGFPSDTAFVVARSEAWLGRGAGGLAPPSLVAYEARVLGYRSLRLPLPEADAGRLPLGWELYADVRGSRARSLAAEVQVGWGVLARVVDHDELADHVVAALDVAWLGAFPTRDAPTPDKPQALAVPLALEARAALGAWPSRRSWLAARASAAPAVVLAGAPRRLVVETAGEAEAHVALGRATARSAHDPALLVRARVLRTTLSLAGARADTEALLAVGVELR